MRVGDTWLVSKWHGEGGGDCGRLRELCAVCYTLRSTAGCLLSGTLIWDEEKAGRGDLKLGWGREEKAKSIVTGAPRGGGSEEEIRIRQQCYGYSLMGYNFQEEKELESWSLMSLSSLLWICGLKCFFFFPLIFLEGRMGLSKWAKLLTCLEVVWTFPLSAFKFTLTY